MSSIQKDIVVGLTFMSGLFAFISGSFIISTVLFASAAMLSNINSTAKLRS